MTKRTASLQYLGQAADGAEYYFLHCANPPSSINRPRTWEQAVEEFEEGLLLRMQCRIKGDMYLREIGAEEYSPPPPEYLAQSARLFSLGHNKAEELYFLQTGRKAVWEAVIHNKCRDELRRVVELSTGLLFWLSRRRPFYLRQEDDAMMEDALAADNEKIAREIAPQ